MDLTKEEIKEFRNIYFKVYGENLSMDEAETKVKRLLRFVALIIDYEELLINGSHLGKKTSNRFEPEF